MEYKNGVGGGRILEQPCTIELERLFSTIGLFAKFKFSLNGVEVCKIKYKEIGIFTTSYELNTLTIKGGGINKRYDFTAYPGYRMRVYNLAGAFLPNQTKYFESEGGNASATQNTVQPQTAPTTQSDTPQAELLNYCPSCGTKFQSGGQFCGQCGFKRN
jgi:hypothetical protein